LRNDRCSGHAGRVHDTFTNLATGAIVSIGGEGGLQGCDGDAVARERLRIQVLEARAVAVVRDMNGNVVLRDRGASWRTFVFDTLGDSEPGGEVLEESIDRVSGPHPLLDMEEAAFCEIVNDLLG
jgi:hypothetical protein